MKPKTAKKELEKQIQKSGTPMTSLTLKQGIRLMLDFYRDIRADDCELDGDGDMLLFQWGTYDATKGRSFQCDITRQFMVAESEDDDAMSQLSFTFHFPQSAVFDKLGDSNEWCSSPDGLSDFESFITGSKAFCAVQDLQPSKVTIEYGGV